MSRREEAVGFADVDVTRRGLLGGVLGGGLAIGAGKAVDNVLVGYGVLTGTNLVDQDLDARVGQRFPSTGYSARVDGHRLTVARDAITIATPAGRTVTLPVGGAAEPAAARDLGAPLEELVGDLGVLAAGDFEFAFARTPAFFDRIANADARPLAVGALRGNRFRTPTLDTIRRFTGTDPAAVEPLIEGLATGFREYAGYDFARYAAGSIEDNLLLGAGDLRDPFRSPAGFDGLLAGENTGLFCYEFAYRSIEALHAVPAAEQSVPVLGAVITDARHKHVYTGIASVIREGGDLVVPMTFVDYTHSTLYDDLGLRGVLGEGIEAYDDRHRTTDVYWNRYARW